VFTCDTIILGAIYSFESKRTTVMAMNYDKLWKLLIDKKMNRTDLHKQAHVSTNAIAAMGKGEDVSTKVLDKICRTLDCDIEDIVTCEHEENK
jgi:putative transcriptional regulator